MSPELCRGAHCRSPKALARSPDLVKAPLCWCLWTRSWSTAVSSSGWESVWPTPCCTRERSDGGSSSSRVTETCGPSTGSFPPWVSPASPRTGAELSKGCRTPGPGRVFPLRDDDYTNENETGAGDRGLGYPLPGKEDWLLLHFSSYQLGMRGEAHGDRGWWRGPSSGPGLRWPPSNPATDQGPGSPVRLGKSGGSFCSSVKWGNSIDGRGGCCRSDGDWRLK